MQVTSLPDVIVISVCIAFGAAGIIHVTGPDFVSRAYRRWGYARPIYRVIGILEFIAAALIALHKTREVGVILGGALNFAAVVTLLKNREYGWALPGMAVAIALPVALIATLRHV